MDRFKAMQVFTQVVEAGSYTRAAAILDMPRSTVTTAVQQLEARLGVRLLHRTTRKVTPSLDGLAYYRRCVSLLEDLAETEATLGAGHRPAGRLRVSLPGRPARKVVIPALPTFCERYPDIELELMVNDRWADLVGEGVDCALRSGPLPDSSLVARRIGCMPEISCAAPVYLERRGIPVVPADLTAHTVVGYRSGRTGEPLPWEYCDQGTVQELVLPGAVTVDDADAYVAAALAGLGMVQLPLYSAHSFLLRGELIEVLADYRPKPTPLSLLYPHRRPLSGRLRVFVEWLEDTLLACPGMIA